jgi:multidrug resistance efflux pump
VSQTPNVNLNDLRIEESQRGSGGRKLVIVFVVILVLGSFSLGWFLQSLGRRGGAFGGGISVRVETVRAGGGRSSASANHKKGGWVEVPSYHPIVVSALVSGRVEDLLVLEGSPVKENDVIARLYARDFKDSLRRAEATVLEALAAVDLMLAGYRVEDVEKARADATRLDEEVTLAEKVLARTRGLVPTGAASAEELERDAAAVEVARARLAGAKQDLARLEAGFRKEEIAKAKATLARASAERDLAKARLSYCEVRSPTKGIVLARHVTEGTWLAPGNPRIVSLYDPDDLQVRVDVRQENAGQVHVGQKVDIKIEAERGRIYHGTVIRIEPLADFKKNTIQAKIRIEDPSEALHPEMICAVEFLQRKDEATGRPAKRELTVASSAILREEGRSYVYKVTDGQAVRTEVRTGDEHGGRVTIESGLNAGDSVVVEPSPDLTDGAAVEIGDS